MPWVAELRDGPIQGRRIEFSVGHVRNELYFAPTLEGFGPCARRGLASRGGLCSDGEHSGVESSCPNRHSGYDYRPQSARAVPMRLLPTSWGHWVAVAVGILVAAGLVVLFTLLPQGSAETFVTYVIST